MSNTSSVMQQPRVSVVMPCLNEEQTLAICLEKAKRALETLDMQGEIIVADNGSTDASLDIARAHQARIIQESKRGYGNVYRAGIAAARGEFIIIGDSDDSYDFGDIPRFVRELEKGYDVVMGNRFKGSIEKKAMPWLHRYIGNPLLTGVLNLFFRAGISDAHCGMRAFTRHAYDTMNLTTAGMEFASEMVIKAALSDLRMTEIPVTLYRDGRSGSPHLRSFRDGWRHLRFMLLYSPTHLFLWPGFTLFALGLLIMIILLPGPFYFAGHNFDTHVMVLGSMLTILGFQIVLLGLYARIFALTHRFIKRDRQLEQAFKFFNLERGILAGGIVFLFGFVINLYILITWISKDFGALDQVREALFASTLIILGVQIVFSSFYMSLLGINQEPLNRNR
ncbi:MAG: glycosyltransferase family 2 protein [candidate division KSB1 bacterium]|nr:glycosyltransferase family 2 protein [candidate division KSB1 bacterium]